MKVLVSDNLADIGIEMFQEADGIDVDVNVGLSPEELKAIIKDYDALVIRSATKVTAEIIEAATNLKVIGRAGIGLDNVDIPAATKNGVVVMNTPEGNVITTAEHTMALMLSLSRNIPQGTATLKAGLWEKKKLRGREMFNKTLGIIGFGRIGSIVANRAKGFKMNVIVHDPYSNKEILDKAGVESVSIEELFKRSDYITVHVPKMESTMGLLNKSAFDQMKNGVMFIHCARGGIVKDADLLEALKSGKVAGAALDVFETEPPGKSPLFELDNVIATPHLGASTTEAQINVAVSVAQQIIDYLQNGTVINAVNVPSVTGELLDMLNPYLVLAERMGSLQYQLAGGAVNEVRIEYIGDFSGVDMSPVTIAALKGFLTPILRDAVNFVNAPAIAKERGIKVVESKSTEVEDYANLITMHAKASDGTNTISGTLFGKSNPRIVCINTSRLDLVPEGHILSVNNEDKPGAIGSIGTLLGKHGINITRMHVGQDTGGDRNVIFLVTDTSAPNKVLQELKSLPLVKSVKQLEL
ncbi:MAG: phosphoglycerate dehydrogenase [Pseudomonadota bacterium]